MSPKSKFIFLCFEYINMYGLICIVMESLWEILTFKNWYHYFAWGWRSIVRVSIWWIMEMDNVSWSGTLYLAISISSKWTLHDTASSRSWSVKRCFTQKRLIICFCQTAHTYNEVNVSFHLIFIIREHALTKYWLVYLNLYVPNIIK